MQTQINKNNEAKRHHCQKEVVGEMGGLLGLGHLWFLGLQQVQMSQIVGTGHLL